MPFRVSAVGYSNVRQLWWMCLILVLMTVAIYWPAYDLSFLYLKFDKVSFLTITFAAFIVLTFTFLAVSIAWSPPKNSDSKSAVAVGWLWFVGMLLPVSGLLQIGPQAMADRYTYPSSLGLAITIAWGSHELALKSSSARVRQSLLILGGTSVVLLCTGLVRHQLPFWRNTEALMGHALQIDLLLKRPIR